jgi:sugar lactone lactonase YvrE
LALDRKGNLYISDEGNERVQRVDRHTGVITTIAGNGITGFSGDHGPARDAELTAPGGLVIDREDRLYIADIDNQRVRRVELSCEEKEKR